MRPLQHHDFFVATAAVLPLPWLLCAASYTTVLHVTLVNVYPLKRIQDRVRVTTDIHKSSSIL